MLGSLAKDEKLMKLFPTGDELEALLRKFTDKQERFEAVMKESRRARQLQTDLALFYRKSAGAKDALKIPYKQKDAYDAAYGRKIQEPVTRLLRLAPEIEENLRIVADYSMTYASYSGLPGAANTFKDQLDRYRAVAKEANDLIREIRGEEE